jgi:hypothetical protein
MKSLYGELVQIDIAKCVNNMVEAMLPRFTQNQVLIISIRMEAENYSTEHRIGKSFSLIFYRPSNYTFVGTRIPVKGEKQMFFFPDNIESELQRHSYHDSCWTSDGTESVIRNMALSISGLCKNDGKNYSVFTTFNEIKLVNAKVDIQDFDSKTNSKFVPLNDSSVKRCEIGYCM